MFIDDVNNRYTYLNTLKNVVWEEPADRIPNPERVIHIHQEIQPVLDRLMRERPTWRYKCSQRFWHGIGPFNASDFVIFDGDEALGGLFYEPHCRDGTPRFYFDNFRLSKTRMKNQKNFSTKPDVAAKRILKAFHLKTPKERAAEAVTETRTLVQTLFDSTSWPLRRAKQVIEQELFEYVSRNWDTMKQHLSDDAAKIDLPALSQAHQDTSALKQAMNDRLGRFVRIEANDTYMVARPENDSYHVESFTDSTLPDDLRGALGLLKLVEDKSHIPEVGVRVDAKLYFVMDRKGENQ